jgi:hypothetical protein
MNTLCQKSNINITELNAAQLQQLQLPTSLTGVGLRAFSTIGPVAYFSSFIEAKELIKTELPTVQHQPLTVAKLAAAHRLCADRGVSIGADFPSISELWTFETKPHLQTRLTDQTDLAAYRVLASELRSSHEDLARLLACTAPHASDWLNADITDSLQRLTSQQFEAALHYRLGYSRVLGKPCHACGTTITRHDHYESCKPAKQAAIIARHNMIASTIGRAATKAGVTQLHEPNHMVNDDGETVRPDLQLLLHPPINVDVVVRNPALPSYCNQSFDKPLHAAKAAEQEKLNQNYDDLFMAYGAPVSPFGMESYGGFGPYAVKLISTLADVASQNTGINPVTFAKELYAQLSVELQAGNALLYTRATASTLKRLRK